MLKSVISSLLLSRDVSFSFMTSWFSVLSDMFSQLVQVSLWRIDYSRVIK